MRHQKTGDKHIIRLDKGEKVLNSLTAWCEESDIHAGFFRGIGAVEYASFGYYDLKEKQYHFTEYNEMLEVASMQGNVALKEGKPFLHVHAVFSGPDNNARGGHVEEMTVGVVLEVVLEPLSEKLDRAHDEDIGLFLMDLPCAPK